jgi:hypothetical protein
MRPVHLLLFAPLLILGAAAPHRTAPARDAAGTVRCIHPSNIVARYPEKPNAVVFEMAGGITYRNDLVGACPSVARSTSASIVQIEVTGGDLCTNDTIRVYDPVEIRGVGPGATARCRLGAFTPVPRH